MSDEQLLKEVNDLLEENKICYDTRDVFNTFKEVYSIVARADLRGTLRPTLSKKAVEAIFVYTLQRLEKKRK